MIDDRKRRGRPKGTELDDSVMLAAIADMLFAHPVMKATTAMRQIKFDASDAEIHRWQDKWKRRKSGLMSEAKARDGEARRKAADKRTVGYSAVDTIRFASSLTGLPTLDPIWKIMKSPEMQLIQELYKNGTMQAIRELKKTEIAAARQMAEDTRQAREMFADPSLKEALMAIEEQREAMRALTGEARF
jgi:hypothetical protein